MLGGYSNKVGDDSERVLLIPPYRVGNKQRRAVLDSLGHGLVVFPRGLEQEAQRYCDFLNEQSQTISHKEWEEAMREIDKLEREIDELNQYIRRRFEDESR